MKVVCGGHLQGQQKAYQRLEPHGLEHSCCDCSGVNATSGGFRSRQYEKMFPAISAGREVSFERSGGRKRQPKRIQRGIEDLKRTANSQKKPRDANYTKTAPR